MKYTVAGNTIVGNFLLSISPVSSGPDVSIDIDIAVIKTSLLLSGVINRHIIN